MSLNGYDISNNQGNINNGLVPSDFVIIKATEGVGYTDPDCDANYQQAKKAGKLLGVYHFARPDGNGPVDEANWFVSQIQGYLNGQTILVLDWETEPKGNVSWVRQFCDTVYSSTGVRCIVYMSASVVNEHDWSLVYNDYGLWVAQYGANPVTNNYTIPTTLPDVNWNPNAPYVMWQYTSNGYLPGWGASLDLDVFYGDRNTWYAYARDQRQTPTPAPTPQPSPAPVTPPQPVQVPVTPEPTTTPPAPQTPVVEPVKASQPTTTPQTKISPVKKEGLMQNIVNQLESNKTILLNVVVTFFQTSFAVWATTNFALDKLALTGAIGAGLSAVWNIVLKPALKAITN